VSVGLYPEPHALSSTNFLGMLPVAVDCSFPGGIAMRYALSVSGLVDDVKFSHYGGMYNSKNSRFHTSIRQRRLDIERKLHHFTRQ